MPKGLIGAGQDATDKIISLFSKMNPKHTSVVDYCKLIKGTPLDQSDLLRDIQDYLRFKFHTT